jgi:hypothetical protein
MKIVVCRDARERGKLKQSFALFLLLPPLTLAQQQVSRVAESSTPSIVSGQLGDGRQVVSISMTPMKIDHLLEMSPDYPLANEGAIWPSAAYAFAAFSKQMTKDTVSGQGASGPLTTLFSFATNKGATANVVSFVGDAVAQTPNSTVFGGNFIARNGAVNGTKLVGLEIDMEPAAGTTISSSSAGLLLNTFNIKSSSPVVQAGALGGGTWGNGFITSHITGSHYSVLSGDPTTSQSFINTVSGKFSQGAAVLGVGTTQSIWFGGGATPGTHPFIYADSSNNFILNLGSAGFLLRNSGGQNQLTMTKTGNLAVNAPASGTTLSVIGVPGELALSTSQPVGLPGFTVSTLPHCNSTIKGGMAYVTDAMAPTYNGTLVGGGAVTIPVFCNGAMWTAH